MEINHSIENNRVWTKIEGHTAYVEYEVNNGTLDIIHTIVPPPLGGQGIAAALVKFVYDYALQQGYTPTGSCSYANVWLKRHPEYIK